MQRNKHHRYEYIFIFSAIYIILLGCNTTSKLKTPQIEIAKEVNLGKIIVSKEQNKFDVEIPLKNLSEKRIRVAHIKTSCNCIISKKSNNQLILEPEEGSVIKLVFIPTELDYGYIERLAFVHFQGYESPILITIKAIVGKE